MTPRLPLAVMLACSLAPAFAADRVYTADQNSNTVSVIDPSASRLLGQIKLGNLRPDVLSPIYRGEVNVHGLGFSPDHRTLIAVSTASNAVTFIDTATNRVKGTAYIGRSPHEGFFTPDGKAVWVVVRGENYISVIDPATFRETGRIPTADGPGMLQFHPDGKRAFVAHSFAPEVRVIGVVDHETLARIPVVSPFSPFLQFTPDGGEVWLTHKDVGKVTRIDTHTLKIKEVIDTGPITNHLAFARRGNETFAYVTVGGENVVKVYRVGEHATPVTTIATGALPHGIWTSGDSRRIYVGLENADAVDVIDTASNRVVARVPVGQAPQALVFVPGVAPAADSASSLVPRVNQDAATMTLSAPEGEASGQLTVRPLGLVDAVDVVLLKLKPSTAYELFVDGRDEPIGRFRSDANGTVMGSVTGPSRRIVPAASKVNAPATQVVVTEQGHREPVLVSR